MTIRKTIASFFTPPGDALPLGIDYFRERLLHYLLLTLAIFGSIAYLPSVYYGFVYNFYSVIAIDTLVVVAFLALLMLKRLSFTAKSIGLLGVFYILGIWLLVALGPTGAGFMWLLLFSIMTGVLLGYRPAMISLGINFISTALLSIPVYTQAITWKLLHADAMAIWTVKGVNFLCINAMVSVSTGFLITKISWMAGEEQHRRKALSREMQARLRAEEEKKELTLRLYQSQKMEAMGTLAGGVAHDFNNILSAILGYTELSLMHPGLPAPVQSNLNHIIKASERAKGIAQQILTFSRHAAVNKAPCDLGQIASECISFFKITMPPGIILECNIPKRPFPMVADKTQIYQVIMNLLTNSRQALDDSPKNRISLSLDWAREGVLDIAQEQDTPLMALVISDTGKGIDSEELSRVFEPYFTTKETGEGTGMGLSISHGIVKEHGGEIRIESAPGKGSTFTVLLPAQSEIAQVPRPGAVPGTGGEEHILMVDDEAHILDIHGQILSDLGYRISTFTNPEQAIEAIRTAPEKIDLVITDRKMEKMTGIDLCKRISRISPDLPVILCTGFPETRDETLFSEVLIKPVTGAELAVAVRQVMDREAFGRAR